MAYIKNYALQPKPISLRCWAFASFKSSNVGKAQCFWLCFSIINLPYFSLRLKRSLVILDILLFWEQMKLMVHSQGSCCKILIPGIFSHIPLRCWLPTHHLFYNFYRLISMLKYFSSTFSKFFILSGQTQTQTVCGSWRLTSRYYWKITPLQRLSDTFVQLKHCPFIKVFRRLSQRSHILRRYLPIRRFIKLNSTISLKLTEEHKHKLICAIQFEYLLYSIVRFLIFNQTNIGYYIYKFQMSKLEENLLQITPGPTIRLTGRESFQMPTPPASTIIIFEAIGIALLTLGVNNSVYANIPDIFVATSLFVAIIFSGPFSGGHVNPAVTMGFVSKTNGISASTGVVYWVGQIIGGILGSLLGVATVGEVNAPNLSLEDPEFLISDLIGESIGTLVFVFFILLITNEITTFSTNTLTTWSCIAGALYIGRHYAIRSGGCLNPGVALGMQIVSVVMDHETYVFKRTWVYAIGPFLGGFLAGKMFDRYLKEFHRARKPEKEDEI